VQLRGSSCLEIRATILQGRVRRDEFECHDCSIADHDELVVELSHQDRFGC